MSDLAWVMLGDGNKLHLCGDVHWPAKNGASHGYVMCGKGGVLWKPPVEAGLERCKLCQAWRIVAERHA